MDNVPTDLLLSSPEEAAEKLACYKLISQRSGGLVKDAGLAEWWKATTDSTGDWLKSTTDSAGDWWKTTASPVVSDYWSKYKNALSGGAGQGAQLATLAGTGAAGFGLLGLIREAAREKKRRNLMNAFYPAIMGGLAGLGGGMAWQNLPQLREGINDLLNPKPEPAEMQSPAAAAMATLPGLSMFERGRRAYREDGAAGLADTLLDPKEWLTGGTEPSTFPGGSIGAGGALTAGGLLTPTALKALRRTNWDAGITSGGKLNIDPQQRNMLEDWLNKNIKSPAGTTRAGRQALRHGLRWQASPVAGRPGGWVTPSSMAQSITRPSLATGTTPQLVLDAFGPRIEGRRPMSLAERALRHPIQAGSRAGATVGDWAARAGLPTGEASPGRVTTAHPGSTHRPGISPGKLRTMRTGGRTGLRRLGGKPLGIASLIPLLFGMGNEVFKTKPIPE